MGHKPAQLLLVYNADGGILNALIHAVHKAVRPETYECSLCAITYGLVSMRGEWRRFLDRLPVEKVFHHRDDFAAAYPGHDFDLPAILTRSGDEAPQLLVSPEDLSGIRDLRHLIDLVDVRLALAGLDGDHLQAVA